MSLERESNPRSNPYHGFVLPLNYLGFYAKFYQILPNFFYSYRHFKNFINSEFIWYINRMELEDEKLKKIIEKEKPYKVVFFKFFFLLTLIITGVFSYALFSAKDYKIQALPSIESQTLYSIENLGSDLFSALKISDAKDTVFKNETVAQVLGAKEIVTKNAINAESITSPVVNKIYDNTVLNVLEQIVRSLPKEQQQRFLNKFQKIPIDKLAE